MEINRDKIAPAILAGVIALALGTGIGTQLDSVQQGSAAQTLDIYPVDLSLAGQHRHDRKNVAEDEAPSIDIDAQRDPMMPGHFNIKLETENFEFAPESVSSEHVMGEGHAHIFVDDVKISRAYGNWYHLPRLEPGEHTITATLNTNDHMEYAIDGTTINATETVTVSESGGMNMDMGQ